jgi:hypothetical protein
MDNYKTLVRYLAAENLKRPAKLARVDRDLWPQRVRDAGDRAPVEVWWSRFFLVQIFKESEGVERITVNRGMIKPNGDWEDGITWDELFQIKSDVGRAQAFAVEIYPPVCDLICDANMRHLWIMPQPLPFAWRRKA